MLDSAEIGPVLITGGARSVQGGCHHEEALLRAQTTAVKTLAPHVSTLAYIGNGASLLCFYDAQNELCTNQAKYSGFFLPEQSGGSSGGGGTTNSSLKERNSNCPTSKYAA